MNDLVVNTADDRWPIRSCISAHISGRAVNPYCQTNLITLPHLWDISSFSTLSRKNKAQLGVVQFAFPAVFSRNTFRTFNYYLILKATLL